MIICLKVRSGWIVGRRREEQTAKDSMYISSTVPGTGSKKIMLFQIYKTWNIEIHENMLITESELSTPITNRKV